MAKIADKYFKVDPWKIIELGFDKSYSRVSEAIFALSNENFGVRGYFDEGGTTDSLKGMYVNGVYEYKAIPKSYCGIVAKTHFMIPACDWLKTAISLDGEELDLGKVNFSDFKRELDMRAGTLVRSFIWHTKSGKDIRLIFTRFTDMQAGERAYQRISFEALNFSGEVKLKSGITFAVMHEGRKECFWDEWQGMTDGNICAVKSRTITSGQEVFAAAVIDSSDNSLNFSGSQENKTAELEAVIPLTEKTPLTIDKKVVILFDGTAGDGLWQAGFKALDETKKVSFEDALKKQSDFWEKYWRLSDVEITPADAGIAETVLEEQQGIRYCSFQMTQTYRGGSLRHNIGAKGLTGEAYNGHAFWDTEACCLPFFLFTNPAAVKSLLMYRYHTLPQALERAEMLDLNGACYPIATLNGEEACDLWQHASLQFQPSTAVAYGIWHYLKVTNDEEFLHTYGAEILVQIARLLVSRAGQNPHTGEYGYYGVMGPDEFHMMVHNNSYTNYMGKRSLEYTAAVIRGMIADKPDDYRKLCQKTDLKEAEIAVWEDIAAKMALPMTEEGLIEQFDGYFDLPYLDIHSIPISDFPLYSHWSYDRIYRTSLIKQPDVLMFLYLYSASFSEDVKRINYEYYEPRTIHESSLSPSVHSILAAELGKIDEATEFFGFATRLDLDNYNRNTHEGLHTTSIAMAWINIVYGFAGLRSDDELIRFAPLLPKRWSRLKFSLTYQNRDICIEMLKDKTVFTLIKGEELMLKIYGKIHTLKSDLVIEN
ncbi:MAG: family 65 glycosyl hydrolase [Lachnospiraceae bacterium]|nr:family 65 glycosyl hydrolase [Lachnospiraceae bacterium]